MKIKQFNIRLILWITAASVVVSSILFLLYDVSVLLPASVILGTIISVFAFDYFNTKKIKRSFGKFMEQLEQGNYSARKNKIIKKYDFVNLIDIQVELSELVGQIRNDNEANKRYLENVSHELLTPIAIIHGKLELLIQSQNVSQNDFILINDILLNLDRLTKVNQSLLLLSKIENDQFTETSSVNLNDLIDEILDLFQDQIRVDQIKIKKLNFNNCNISINESLAYLLIKNLIKNAVMHNIENGSISIDLSPSKLSITNTGNEINKSTDELFERFSVSEESENSIGLGLAIVQKICESNNILLNYTSTKGIHTLELTWNSSSDSLQN